MEALKLSLAYFLDLLFGDPRWLPHPVKAIGKATSFLERLLNRGNFLRVKGILLAIIVIGGTISISLLILELCRRVSPMLETILWLFLAYTCLSTKDLSIHGYRVLEGIENKDLRAAQQRLSLIVGRDTENLPKEKIITAAIESVAESTNDGIIAPLFYLTLGGVVLGIGYKAINTLDSMVGYKNEKYLDFGWFSARIDDLANFIPARLTGLLIIASSFILRKDFVHSFKIMIRDGKKHFSPNSGICESAMAGALGIRLGGPSTYQGRLLDKPYLGEDKLPIKAFLIKDALKISFFSSFLMFLLGVAIKWVI